MLRPARKAVLTFGLGLLSALFPNASDAAPPPETGEDQPEAADPDSPAVQRPKASGGQQAEQPDKADAAGEDAPPTDEPKTGDPKAEATTDTAAQQPDPTSEAKPDPKPAPSPEPGKADMGNLLAPGDDAELPAGRPVSSGNRNEAGISGDEKATRYYDRLYRPADNPSRFAFGARALFMAGSANGNEMGARMGGVTVEAGQSWNWINYALTATVYGGQGLIGEDQYVEFNTMVGGGPTLGLGRLALVRMGYLDARIGYDFFYSPTKVSFIGVSDGIDSAPANVTPHGPRFRLDMGLLIHKAGGSKWRHGVGATFGYQTLVGSFTSDFPLSHVLMIGLNYVFG